MKKSDIKLFTDDYTKEFAREATMRLKVYQKQIDAGKLSKYSANKRLLIIQNTKELFEEMERVGISFEQILAELNKIKTLYRPEQGTLFKQTQYP